LRYVVVRSHQNPPRNAITKELIMAKKFAAKAAPAPAAVEPEEVEVEEVEGEAEVEGTEEVATEEGGEAKEKGAPRARKWNYGIKPESVISKVKDGKSPGSVADQFELITPKMKVEDFMAAGGDRHGLRVMMRAKAIILTLDGAQYPVPYDHEAAAAAREERAAAKAAKAAEAEAEAEEEVAEEVAAPAPKPVAKVVKPAAAPAAKAAIVGKKK
jgi:hypothetical protein